MSTARLPFESYIDGNTGNSILCKRIISNHWHFYEEEEDRISPSLQDLIKFILVTDPENRPTVDDILEHPWLIETSTAKRKDSGIGDLELHSL